MQNKFIQITFNALDYSMQQQISKYLSKEICLRMKTPPIDDPCADTDEMESNIIDTLCKIDPILAEVDLLEIGKEAGI